MDTDRPHENPGPEPAVAFHLAPAQLLPAICPACGAPGTRSETVALSDSRLTHAELDAHYCDICADDRNTSATRELAWLGACTLLVLASTTALALALGSRDGALQLVMALLLGGALPVALRRVGWWSSAKEPLELHTDSGGMFLSVHSKAFCRSLREHGFEERGSYQAGRVSFLRKQKIPVALALLGVVWLAVLHSLGGAEVRVFVSGREKAVLLVDQRHSGKVAPTNAEDPRAGGSLRVLGGRRHLEIISESGALLGGATMTIWPGRTYIVGHLPQHQCLFWEQRTYGKGVGRSLVFPIGGDGPVWELRHQVDSWFIPLESTGAKHEVETDPWETRGGIRRAIRLLPCRAQIP